MRVCIEKAAAYATAMADRYLCACQKLEIMEPFVSGDIPNLFDNSYGAHAHTSLALTLILDLIRDACAFALDEDSRAASLANVWRIIEPDEVRAALRSRAAQPNSCTRYVGSGRADQNKTEWEEQLRLQDIAQKGRQFDEAYGRCAKGVPAIVQSELAKKFSTARDKTIAHYEMRGGRDGPVPFNLEDVGLTWGAPRQFFDLLDPVVWDAVLAATWGSYAVEEFNRMHRLTAADFWARLRGKPPVTGVN